MNQITVLILFACLFITVNGERVQYDDYRVYSVEISNEKHLKLLQELESIQNEISFINIPTVIAQTVDVIVPPHKCAEIREFFKENDLQHSLKGQNLQK